MNVWFISDEILNRIGMCVCVLNAVSNAKRSHRTNCKRFIPRDKKGVQIQLDRFRCTISHCDNSKIKQCSMFYFHFTIFKPETEYVCVCLCVWISWIISELQNQNYVMPLSGVREHKEMRNIVIEMVKDFLHFTTIYGRVVNIVFILSLSCLDCFLNFFVGIFFISTKNNPH